WPFRPTNLDIASRAPDNPFLPQHGSDTRANANMDQLTHNTIVSFIWGIADDGLRDLFVRGKYRDVILPMCVLRRLDAVLEPTKKAVLDTKKILDKVGITEQRAALTQAAG